MAEGRQTIKPSPVAGAPDAYGGVVQRDITAACPVCGGRMECMGMAEADANGVPKIRRPLYVCVGRSSGDDHDSSGCCWVETRR